MHKPFFLSSISARSEFNNRVQRDFHPRRLVLGNIHEVGVDAAQHSLVGYNHDILAAFHFHDDRFEADDHIAVRFAALVAVVVPIRCISK